MKIIRSITTRIISARVMSTGQIAILAEQYPGDVVLSVRIPGSINNDTATLNKRNSEGWYNLSLDVSILKEGSVIEL